MSDDKKRLIASIVRFINDEIRSGNFNEDQRESLQVAKECFTTAYGIASEDDAAALDLLALFVNASSKADEQDSASAPSACAATDSDRRAEAERLKQTGNEAMMAGRYEEAEQAYSSAIKVDGNNAVYFANRAAARAKLGNRHNDVVSDCEKALAIDANYAKAHYRLGCAHLQAGAPERAVASLRRAVELDSANEAYRAAHDDATARLAGAAGSAASPFGQMGDFAAMLNNPGLVQTAMQIFQNPEMRQMVANLAGQANMGGAGEASAGAGAGAGVPDMSSLMSMGQQMAAVMQQQNPELVEQLRRQFQQTRPDAGPRNPPAP